MDINTIVGLLALLGILLLCYIVWRSQRAWRGGHRTEQELDALYGKGRNQRTED